MVRKDCENEGLIISTMSETDKAYLAGIIDGEGCISIYNVRSYYTVRIQIDNTNYFLISKIASLLGLKKRGDGSYFNIDLCKLKQHKNQKEIWSIRISSINFVFYILSAVSKYLVVKKGQCDLVLSFIDLYKKYKEGGGHASSGCLNDNKILKIVDRVRELNIRGNSNPGYLEGFSVYTNSLGCIKPEKSKLSDWVSSIISKSEG